jgi:hypothetical protein
MKKTYNFNCLFSKTAMFKTFGMLAFMLLTVYTFAQSNASVIVTAPSGAEVTIPAWRAAFGPAFTMPISGPVIAAVDTNTVAPTACAAVTNDLTGAIALIDRGICGFPQKVLNAQAAGAIAVIVCNNVSALPGQAVLMGGDDMGLATIPAVMISFGACQSMRVNLGNGLEVTLSPDGVPPAPAEICSEAVVITPGTHTVDAVNSGFGAVFASAFNARWYSYTATDNGLVTVTNCGDAADSRLVVLTGLDCELANLVVVGSNDDCDGDNNIFSSEFSFIGQVGERYFIYWDDRWDDSGFDFDLTVAALPTATVTFQADMREETVGVDGVSAAYAPYNATGPDDIVVVGLADDDLDGIWTGSTTLNVLDTIGYFYINGATALANFETVPADCGLEVSILGLTFNIRPLIVSGDEVLPANCFSACGPCSFEVTDCNDPLFLIEDDASAYDIGNLGVLDYWQTWPGATLGIQIDTLPGAGGDNVFAIIGNPASQDVFLSTGNLTAGHYSLSFIQYIPAGNNAYFNVQHQVPTAAAGFWAFDVFYDGDGEGRLALNDDADTEIAFTYPEDEWFDVILFFDLDNDEARLIVGEYTVGMWKFSDGVTNGGAELDNLQLSGVNFYPIDATHVWYLDDVVFLQIPAAGEGQYCYTATSIEPGTHTVNDLSCYGGGIHHDDGDGLSAQWFTYTPTEDGWISLSSCEGGVDSRGWILTGTDCRNLDIVGVNDDQCLTSPGATNSYASYREAVVKAGETYYIMWDNVWENTGFDFTLEFNTTDLVPGDFCESAVDVTPGVYGIEAFTGNAAVTGPIIDNTSQGRSPTPYAMTEWYQFTPTTDGLMTLTSCNTSASDNRVWVYTGECGTLSSLTLVATDDDGCGSGGTTLLEDFAVTAGTTYYIEWDNGWDSDAFEWELIFGVPTSNVTFQVDMNLADISPDGVFVAGSFNGFTNLAMEDANADGIYTATAAVENGTRITYKFKNGPDGWENINTSIGDNCTTGDFADRFFDSGDMDLTLDVVCFTYCVTCNVVDVDEATFNQGVQLFPNPTSGELSVQIQLPEVVENLNLRMINMLGSTVLQRQLGSLSQYKETLDLSQLPTGTYVLQLTSGGLQINRKVVVK